MQSKHARGMQLVFHLIGGGGGFKSCIFIFDFFFSNRVDLGFLFAVFLLSPVIPNLT